MGLSAVLALRSPALADDHGDDCAGPTVVEAGAALVRGQHETAADQDWFDLPVQPGEVVYFGIEPESPQFWPRLTVFAADCQTLLGAADRDAGESGVLVQTPASGNTQWLRLRVDSFGPEVGGYRVTFDRRGVAGDDYVEPTPIDIGQVVQGRVDFDGDADVFRVGAAPRSVLRVEIAATAPPCCPYSHGIPWLRVLVDDRVIGTPVGFEFVPDPGQFIAHMYVVPRWMIGDVRIEVGGYLYPDAATVQYRLRVSVSGGAPNSDDHGDGCGNATTIVPGDPAQACFLEASDDDRFEFTAQAGHLYAVYVDAISPLPDARLRWIAGGCDEIAAQTSIPNRRPPGPSVLTQYVESATLGGAPGPTVLSLAASSTFDDPRIGLYGVRVVDMGLIADDHANTEPYATLLPVDGATVQGRIDYVSDDDWFQFEFGEAREYIIETRSLDSSGSPNIDLMGPDGERAAILTCYDCQTNWRSHRIVVAPGGGGTWRVLVSSFREVDYQFRVVDAGPAIFPPFAAECGSARVSNVTASPIASVVWGVAAADHVAFDLAPRRKYRIDQTRLTANAPTVLAYIGCDERIDRFDESGAPLEFESGASAVQRLVLQVHHTGSAAVASALELRVIDLGAATDTIGPDSASARVHAVNAAPLVEAIDYAGDVDRVRVRLRGGFRYRVESQIEAAVQGQWLVVDVSPASGLGWYSNWTQSGYPYGVRSAWEGADIVPPMDGDYFVTMTPPSGTSRGPGAYRLRIIKPECRADLDDSGGVSLDDLFAYLERYLSGGGAGEFDGAGETDVGDLFAFIGAWFDGCR